MYSVVLATMLVGGEAAPSQWGCSCAGSRYVAYQGGQGCHGYSSYYGCAGCRGVSFYHGSVSCAPVVVSCSCHGPSCSGCFGTPRVMPIPAAPVPLAVPTPAPPSAPPGVLPGPPTPEPPAIREESASVRLTTRSAPVATSATLTVRLPADARLYVDNVVCPLTSSVRSFTTTGLEPGREYYYALRAELVRNGTTHVQSQRVRFEAGRQVEVNFADPVGRIFNPSAAVRTD